MNATYGRSFNQRMKYYENSLKTFETYPKQMLPDKYELKKAGLYCKRKLDMCEFRMSFKIERMGKIRQRFERILQVVALL
jgi:hypothetical protein